MSENSISSEGNESTEVSNSKKRKGVVNSDLYKRNVIKKARVVGKEYVNYKNNRVTARSTGDDCNCKLKCFSKFSDDDFIVLLNGFSSFKDKDSQDSFLQGLIEKHEVQNRRNKQARPNPCTVIGTSNHVKKERNFSFKYYISKAGEKVLVCKKAFVAVYGISDKRVVRLCKLLVNNKGPVDKCGKNRSGNAISGEVCQKIHDHIESYPSKVCHYEKSEKYYLDSRLNIKILFEMFQKKHPECKVSYFFFRQYFQENFDLKFGRPQVDVCVTCETLKAKLRDKTLNDNAKRVAAAELIVHSRRAKTFYKKMQEYSKIEDSSTLVICFDYMQNLPLPHNPVQDIFYLRQLWVFVFCIHN